MKKRLALTSGYFIIMAVTVFLLMRYSSANLRNSVSLLLTSGAIIALTSLYKKEAKERFMLPLVVGYILFFTFLLFSFLNPPSLLFCLSTLFSVILLISVGVARVKKDKSDYLTYEYLVKNEDGTEDLVPIQ